MNLLAFDTSTAATSVCLLREDGRAFEVWPDPEDLHAPPAHAGELLPRVAQVMEEAEVGFGELGAIAVGVGPGTFTGLRIGVATARALAEAHGVGVCPVSSLAALAAGAEAELALAVLDARRGEAYAALYEGGHERWAPAAAPPGTLAERVRAEGLRPRAAGDGSVRFRRSLEDAGAEIPPDDWPGHVVRALHVARLGERTPPSPPEAVLPHYVRAPDAQPRPQR